MKTLKVTAILTVLASPVLADDVEDGAEAFDRQCSSCHMIKDGDETLAGRGRNAPNLYGIAGRAPGTDDFRNYGDSLVAAGQTGIVWDEEQFVVYVQDPTDWLRATTGDNRARSKMGYKVRNDEDAEALWAYLATFGG